MKRVLIVIGVVAVVCFAVFAAVFAFLMIRGRGDDESSAKAAHDIVQAIVSNWDEEAFAANSSPDLARIATPEERQRLFKLYRRLGALQSLEKPEGESQAVVGLGSFKTGITATYRMRATFANGPATIRVRLRKNDDKWQLEGFTVLSKVFLPS